jgi:hypothetical protein
MWILRLLHNIAFVQRQGFHVVVNQGALNVLRRRPTVPNDWLTQTSNLNQRKDVYTKMAIDGVNCFYSSL